MDAFRRMREAADSAIRERARKEAERRVAGESRRRPTHPRRGRGKQNKTRRRATLGWHLLTVMPADPRSVVGFLACFGTRRRRVSFACSSVDADADPSAPPLSSRAPTWSLRDARGRFIDATAPRERGVDRRLGRV